MQRMLTGAIWLLALAVDALAWYGVYRVLAAVKP